jgi:hypothetical protein
MIKHAEVQNAYLQGRQAAMVKLADPAAAKKDPAAGSTTPDPSLVDRMMGGLGTAYDNQKELLDNIGLTSGGFLNPAAAAAGADPTLMAQLNPMRLANMKNLSRAGMLGGAAGGAYLGGLDPRAAAIAAAGGLGGGVLGANLGQAAQLGLEQFMDAGNVPTRAQAEQVGAALGGLGGGLGAGYLA